MNDLREQVANELDTFRTVADARSRGGDDPMDVAWEFVPRFMAHIAEAMLSDSAVIAAENAGEPDSVLGVHHHCGTDAVQAALTAAGITGAGQEGGEEVFNCPNCEGTGLYDDCTCSVCEGEGELTQRQWDGN